MRKIEILHDDEVTAIINFNNDKIEVTYLGKLVSAMPVEKIIKRIRNELNIDVPIIDKLVLEKDVEDVAPRCFSGRKINSLLIKSNKLKQIGSFAFANCSLKEVVFDKRKNNKNVENEGLEVLKNGCFISNDLEEIIIPDTVTRIEEQAFSYNDLKNTYIPIDNLENYKGNAFAGNPDNVFHKKEKEQVKKEIAFIK